MSDGGLTGQRVYVAGHRGMVGSALVRRLQRDGVEILTTDRAAVDLRDQAAVHGWLAEHKPDSVVVAAAKVGGIYANDTFPAEFLYDNLMIEANLIHGSHAAGIDRLLFLGSSCIYPRLAEQPMREDALLTGPLEPTNEWYAIAKIAGIKLCDAYRRQYGRRYISAMPTNLYGPGDNFHPEHSHVVPALLRRFHEAAQAGQESVAMWGTGSPLREFLHVDDLADALALLLDRFDEPGHINVGSEQEISIADLARTIADVVGFEGRLDFDTSKPDGTPRKLMASDRIREFGWTARIGLREGLEDAYRWWLDHQDSFRG